MPRLSAWFVRFSLIYLAVGFTLGSLMLANEGLSFSPDLNRILPAHIEILMVGWFLQLALGVAYWILPRNLQGLPRGNKFAAWAALVLVNTGIVLVGVSVLFNTSWLMAAGRIIEIIGILAFLSIAWRRLRSSG